MKDRDCENCKHYVKSNEGNTEALFGELYSCESWECNFEPKEEGHVTRESILRCQLQGIVDGLQDADYDELIKILVQLKEEKENEGGI